VVGAKQEEAPGRRMGGANSTNQVRETITTNLTRVVTSTMISKTSTANQNSTQTQIISKIRIIPAMNCPPGVSPGSVNIRNGSKVTMSTMLSVFSMSAEEITDKITKSLQTTMDNQVKKEKDGTLAFSDKTNLNQVNVISDVTIRDIKNTVQMTLDTYMSQTARVNQVITDVVIPQPCGSNVTELTNDSYVSMVASDMVMNVMKTVTDSVEWKKYEDDMKAKDDQKSRDVFGQATDMIKSLGDNIQNLGMAGVGGVALVAVALILFIPFVLRSLFGGGGGSKDVSNGGGGDGGGNGGERLVGDYDPPIK
jgi:hypothetical protein